MASKKTKKTKEAEDLTFGFEFDDIEGFCEEEDPLDGLILGGDILAAKVEAVEKTEKAEAEEVRDAERTRTVAVFKTMTPTRKLKLLSEAALDEALDWHLEEGMAYHCVSFGDVDSLTYLRHVLRQQRLEYLMVSTWYMALEDAQEIAGWVERGMIGRIDFYVGEIFKNGYRGVRDAIEAIARATGGRVARFRNHSKVMAGLGESFGFAIESSANINTNPRTEQTVVTTDDGLALFYKEFFDGINSFDAGFEDWTPYQPIGARYARTD